MAASGKGIVESGNRLGKMVKEIGKMDLNINSPAYYTKEFGVEDEIYWFCRELSCFVKEKKYNDVITTIGLVPIIAPKEEIEKGLWKETKKCCRFGKGNKN